MADNNGATTSQNSQSPAKTDNIESTLPLPLDVQVTEGTGSVNIPLFPEFELEDVDGAQNQLEAAKRLKRNQAKKEE